MTELIVMILIGSMIGAGAFVFAVPLQMPGEIFSFLPVVANYVPAWISKPLFACQKCVAGQWSLWLFPFWICPRFGIEYDLFLHILEVTTAIFFAVLFSRITISTNAPAKAKRSNWTPPEINQP